MVTKKAKSPTGRPSKKKAGVKEFDEGRKSAGSRKSAYTGKKKAPKPRVPLTDAERMDAGLPLLQKKKVKPKRKSI
jgi:hypothetical protein